MVAFLLPAGLQAKSLIDFCLMEKNTHAMMDSESTEHCDDSEPDKKEPADHPHNDCDWSVICPCDIGQSPLGDENWIVITKDAAVELIEQKNRTQFYATDDPIPPDLQPHPAEHSPPLWLVYDTLLL